MEVNKLLCEFLGTFVFLFTILQSGRFNSGANLQPWVVVSGLLVAIFMCGSVSGGHFNPAVSVMLHAGKDANVGTLPKLGSYVSAQVLGGLAALMVHRRLTA
jgi:glycerol uptake facilitator-like aquaporin